MRFFIGLWVTAIVAWAQAPYVYRPGPVLKADADWGEEGRTVLAANASGLGPPFHVKPIDANDPNTRKQEDRTPPLYPNPNCFVCPRLEEFDGDNDRERAENWLHSYTTDQFIELSKDAYRYDITLRNRCMFYTRNTRHGKRLSRGATEIACRWDKLSIWHLWPNAKNARDTRNHNPPMINYYGLYITGETLNFIPRLPNVWPNKPAPIHYFENMARAMARMCSGRVYLVTDMAFPFDLNLFRQGGIYWPNIWMSTEWPELGNRIAAGAVDGESLIVVEFTTLPYPKPRAWKVQWRTLLVRERDRDPTEWKRDGNSSSIPEHLFEPYDLDSELPEEGTELHRRMLDRRASCDMEDTGIDSEHEDMDFFG